jgi:hypothetical protein
MTNNVRRLVTVCGVAIAGMFLVSSPATAQPACPPATDTPYTGTLGQGQSTGPITIDLQPCETVYVELQATVGGTHPSRDAQMTLRIRNNANEDLSINDFACVASCGQTVPRNPSNGEGYPLPGTRGDQGLAETFSLRVNVLGWYASGPVTYTMWVRRRPRPGYNIGGTTFTNATLVGRNETLYASLSDKEIVAGQYYKFILPPGGSVRLSGLVTANSTYGATFMGYLYDANYQYLMTLADFGTWGTTVFPQTSNPPTYTNTSGSDKTYYLRIRAMWWSIWDVQIRLRDPATTPSFDVGYATYIPVDHVDGPSNCRYVLHPFTGESYIPLIYKGDANRGTYRAAQAMTVRPTVPTNEPMWQETGTTENYDAFNSPVNGSTLSAADEDQVAYDCHRFNEIGHASTASMSGDVQFPFTNQAHVIFSGNPANPLETGSPGITWDMRTVVNVNANGTANAYVNYNHDCYPSFHVRVNGRIIYSYAAPQSDTFYIAMCLTGVYSKIVGEQPNPTPVPVH